MISTNPVHEVCDYAVQALYCEPPNLEQIRAGVVPLGSLPAAWWNWMWNDTNKAVNEARGAIGVMVNELCNVLVGAGICPSCSCLDQLYQSINRIRQTLATATVAGAVKSSSNCGEVSVDGTTGIMTANGLGNAAQLATSARTAIGAINELKQTYDCCISTINTCTSALNTGKAPVSHASSVNTYGVGNATNYGHVRLSDTFASYVGGVAEGVAASQKALYDMYTCITSAGYVTLGNTAGCALGTASAGTANTAARSDHVHPTQSCIPYTGTGYSSVTAYQTLSAWCGSAAEWASYLVFNHGDGSCYYNQMIRMPFYGVPQYQRKSNGTDSGWKTFITSENIGSQSVCYAASAGTAGNATSATVATKACCACGIFYLEDGGINLGSNGMLTGNGTNWTGIFTACAWGVGRADTPGYLRTCGNNLYHYRRDTGCSYTIYDTGNLNPMPKSGGTFTGAITAVANAYACNGACGLNMNNSDIIGANGIYFDDIAEVGEGIFFKRTNNTYDSIRMCDGYLYFGCGGVIWGCIANSAIDGNWICNARYATDAGYAQQAGDAYVSRCTCSLRWHTPTVNVDFKVCGGLLYSEHSFFMMPRTIPHAVGPNYGFPPVNVVHIPQAICFAGCSYCACFINCFIISNTF